MNTIKNFRNVILMMKLNISYKWLHENYISSLFKLSYLKSYYLFFTIYFTNLSRLHLTEEKMAKSLLDKIVCTFSLKKKKKEEYYNKNSIVATPSC